MHQRIDSFASRLNQETAKGDQRWVFRGQTEPSTGRFTAIVCSRWVLVRDRKPVGKSPRRLHSSLAAAGVFAFQVSDFFDAPSVPSPVEFRR